MLVELIKDLVAIDSSTKEGANKAVDYCSKWLANQGLPISLIENNGYKMLVCEIGNGDKTLIFNGHVDVVSGKPDQFIPVVEEGKLYGRGAADMKAGVAAMMCAISELQHDDLGLKIQLQIVSDEETGGFNCSGYLAKQGYLGDFVICSEPTQMGIALQAKGIVQADIEITGSPSHGSRPWEGINAIEKAYDVYQKIRSLPFTEEKTEFYASPSINLAKIRAGEVYNKVPDKCMMSFDIRYLPTQNKDEIIRQIEEITDGTVIEKMFSQPVNTRVDDPYITMLRPVIKSHTKNDAVIFGQHGSADTVYFAALGIPAIEFGPSGANWHGDREYVELESVSTYQKMLIDFAQEFLNTK
ncbi:M20/M25/M40 family metallo-hydrolase [Bacillus sp. CECT 9360]|uniref:M20 family metallopeptidase n=1 Tax=Bacillus sp. CECT 9360 TaxID=2845821 RepID=UPI001E60C69F|nr:M20/M25/M40 family metallo-hydrolase [Bacillus sp. CECT 9360]CAH0345237.1 Acetylornithine deacetylase [Bacillus sp. CECT 9360]